jgi:hypothetical protein
MISKETDHDSLRKPSELSVDDYRLPLKGLWQEWEETLYNPYSWLRRVVGKYWWYNGAHTPFNFHANFDRNWWQRHLLKKLEER